jgi:CheY-like chemotaxis protein
MNLAVNAKDAMPEGGELAIQTQSTRLDEAYCRNKPEIKLGRYVLLTVSDTGCGINKETLEHIFDPFYTTKGLAQGTGLGLAMVYGILKSHGGHVECISTPGVGTCFRIYIPAFEQKAHVARTVKTDRPKGGSETILLVDDEEIIRDVGQSTLTRFGYTVLTAEDGEIAVERYRRKQKQIDLVLLDLVMPKMSGKSCLEALIRINPRIKIVVASGYSETESRTEVLRAGARKFIAKPYEANTLLSAVREALDAD